MDVLFGAVLEINGVFGVRYVTGLKMSHDD
jgi:hypothetical protein